MTEKARSHGHDWPYRGGRPAPLGVNMRTSGSIAWRSASAIEELLRLLWKWEMKARLKARTFWRVDQLRRRIATELTRGLSTEEGFYKWRSIYWSLREIELDLPE